MSLFIILILFCDVNSRPYEFDKQYQRAKSYPIEPEEKNDKENKDQEFSVS